MNNSLNKYLCIYNPYLFLIVVFNIYDNEHTKEHLKCHLNDYMTITTALNDILKHQSQDSQSHVTEAEPEFNPAKDYQLAAFFKII